MSSKPNDPTSSTPLSQSAFDTQVGGAHYKSNSIQPIDFILSNGVTFVEGSVIKYVYRWKDKGGVEDLKKARHFLEMLIEHEERKVP
jgi:hypothetical protein